METLLFRKRGEKTEESRKYEGIRASYPTNQIDEPPKKPRNKNYIEHHPPLLSQIIYHSIDGHHIWRKETTKRRGELLNLIEVKLKLPMPRITLRGPTYHIRRVTFHLQRDLENGREDPNSFQNSQYLFIGISMPHICWGYKQHLTLIIVKHPTITCGSRLTSHFTIDIKFLHFWRRNPITGRLHLKVHHTSCKLPNCKINLTLGDCENPSRPKPTCNWKLDLRNQILQ